MSLTVDDDVEAIVRRLCDHQRAKGVGADMSLAELRLALGVTEAQLMEAVRVLRLSSDLFLAFTTPAWDRVTLGPSWRGRCEKKEMIEEDALALDRDHPSSRGFHGLSRAQRDSRPVVIVDYEGPDPPGMTIEIGLGESNREQTVLRFAARGRLEFPENVSSGQRVSVRADGLPVRRVVNVTIRWEASR